MAGTRVQIDLFFKDKTPQQVNKEHPKLLELIKKAKARASNMEGEMTVLAQYHICHHDEPGNTISCNDTRVEI